MALTYTPAPDLGKNPPPFQLPGVDGKTYGLSDFQNGQPLVIMFICNHCPYVKAIEDRLIQLGHDCNQIDVNVVAICSNDADDYPEDNFASLKARWSEKKYPFPYLHDADQAIAKDFGAVCTPDFFVYDKNLQLAYRGRLDDSWKEPQKVTKRELFNAILTLKEGKKVSPQQTPSMGCSIKWSKP
jgi:peroxiredoxin